MDINRYRRELLNKQQELEEEIGRLEAEGREGQTAEVEDPMDQVTSAEAKAGALEQVSRATTTLHTVEEALARIQDGSYGRCIDCGREIQQARLDAVPWTAYCREDQERHDSQTASA